MLSKKMEVADLFAFYGQLLTDKQKDILTLYCLDDYSLGEIADDLGISRQGVHDAVKRASKTLIGYEEKLGLMNKFNMNTSLLNDINTRMVELAECLNDQTVEDTSFKNKVQETITIVIEDIENMIE